MHWLNGSGFEENGQKKTGMGYNDLENEAEDYKVKQWETKQNIWCRSSSNQSKNSSSINYNLCECPVCRHDII